MSDFDEPPRAETNETIPWVNAVSDMFVVIRYGRESRVKLLDRVRRIVVVRK